MLKHDTAWAILDYPQNDFGRDHHIGDQRKILQHKRYVAKNFSDTVVVVDDLPDAKERSEWLWEELEELIKNDSKRAEMRTGYETIERKDAAKEIAQRLINLNIS